MLQAAATHFEQCKCLVILSQLTCIVLGPDTGLWQLLNVVSPRLASPLRIIRIRIIRILLRILSVLLRFLRILRIRLPILIIRMLRTFRIVLFFTCI